MSLFPGLAPVSAGRLSVGVTLAGSHASPFFRRERSFIHGSHDARRFFGNVSGNGVASDGSGWMANEGSLFSRRPVPTPPPREGPAQGVVVYLNTLSTEYIWPACRPAHLLLVFRYNECIRTITYAGFA